MTSADRDRDGERHISVLARGQLSGLSSDHQLFVGLDHDGLDAGTFCRDDRMVLVAVHARVGVSILVEHTAEELEALKDPASHARAVFANAAREHDRIDATHGSGVCADVLAGPMRKDVDREARPVITVCGRALDFSKVVSLS